MDVIISLELQLIFVIQDIYACPCGRDHMDLQLPMQSVPITT